MTLHLHVRCLVLMIALLAAAQADAQEDQAAPKVLTLSMPAPATETARRTTDFGSYNLPQGVWAEGTVPVVQLEGRIAETAWRLDTATLGSAAIFASLRDQLLGQGYRPILECETEACGGFDFRYGLALLPEPEMHVDLGDFRFFAAESGGGAGTAYLALMVSRSREAGYVQITTIAPVKDRPVERPQADVVQPHVTIAPDQSSPQVTLPIDPPSDLGTALLRDGFAPLADLKFESGKAELAAGDYPSLDALARFLADNPAVTIALVGHTDASGGLDGNTILSRARAEAVRARLIADFGVSADRIAAQGVGFLAPRTSNQTPEGRAQNRRVEVIVTSTP